MYSLLITPLDVPAPAEIISLELIKEFLGLDDDLDAEQDKVLPELRQAAIEQGEQITGIKWAATAYRIDGLYQPWSGVGFLLPLTPIFSVSELVGKDSAGADVQIEPATYVFNPSVIELGSPWARLLPITPFPSNAVTFSVTCIAGWEGEKLPGSLRSWALQRIATAYDHRMDLLTGSITEAMPRHHVNGLLDRWTVRSTPNG